MKAHTIVVPITLALLMAACGGADGGDEVSPTDGIEATSTKAPAGAPCFGLAQVATLPDWAGGLAFGERHDLAGGSFVDLTSRVGCEIERGVVTVNKESEDRLFGSVYVEDCDGFESSDIPPQELRPAADDRWICYEPSEEGGLRLTQREG